MYVLAALAMLGVMAENCTLLPEHTFEPGCAGYLARVPVYNKALLHNSPGTIYAANSTADVARAVCAATAAGLEIRVRAGGHSFTGESTCSGAACLQIDLTAMRGTSFDAASGIATVGPGARSMDVYAVLDPLGVTVVSGSCLPVGFGGLALGGGYGLLSREHGLAADRIVGFELVLPNATVASVDAAHDPELYWALRGGGHANFGIVTSFRVRTVDTSKDVFQFRLFTPKDAAAAPQALVAWQALAATADRRVHTQFSMTNYKTGPPSFNVIFQFNGTTAEADALFRASGLLDFVVLAECKAGGGNPVNGSAEPPLPWGCDDMPYAHVHELVGYCGFETDRGFAAHSRYLVEPLSLTHATALWDAFRVIHSDTYGCKPEWADLMFDPFGGAIADVAPAGTAFPHRGALAQLQYNVFWDGPTAPKGCVEWLDGLYTASGDFLPNASYVNYPSAELVNYGTSYFGANYVRLQKLKAAVDPAGAFAYPQSIQPAGS
jgi:hypothetical protein